MFIPTGDGFANLDEGWFQMMYETVPIVHCKLWSNHEPVVTIIENVLLLPSYKSSFAAWLIESHPTRDQSCISIFQSIHYLLLAVSTYLFLDVDAKGIQ